MSSKTSLAIKKELVALYQTKRGDERCQLVKKLMESAKTLTASVDAAIDAKKKETDLLERQKHDILKHAKLVTFERYRTSCPLEELHPSLIQFDEETRTGIATIYKE